MNDCVTDESYIHATPSVSKTWTYGSNKDLLKPLNKGQRLIIIHAGRGAHLFQCPFMVENQSSGGYHNQTNRQNYEKWLQKKSAPILKPNSVIVVDNASYEDVCLLGYVV
jgi:hypothetical protein